MTTAHRPCLESLEERQMSQHLRDVEDRLVDRYTQRQNIPADRVRQAFSLATEHFANARIHAYLPILLERAVDRQLNGR